MYSWYSNLATNSAPDPDSRTLSFKFYFETGVEVFQTPGEVLGLRILFLYIIYNFRNILKDFRWNTLQTFQGLIRQFLLRWSFVITWHTFFNGNLLSNIFENFVQLESKLIRY